MKSLLAGLIVSSVVAGAGAIPSAHADEFYVTPVQTRPMRSDMDRYGAHRLKVAGIVLSVIGTASLVTGAAIAGSSRRDDPGVWTTADSVGTAFAVQGAIALTTGIPMWVIGGLEERRHGVVRIGMSATGAHGTF